MTGMYPPRIGPLDSKWHAMIILSCFITRIEDELPDLIKDDETARIIIEDELGSVYRKKGR